MRRRVGRAATRRGGSPPPCRRELDGVRDVATRPPRQPRTADARTRSAPRLGLGAARRRQRIAAGCGDAHAFAAAQKPAEDALGGARRYEPEHERVRQHRRRTKPDLAVTTRSTRGSASSTAPRRAPRRKPAATLTDAAWQREMRAAEALIERAGDRQRVPEGGHGRRASPRRARRAAELTAPAELARIRRRRQLRRRRGISKFARSSWTRRF